MTKEELKNLVKDCKTIKQAEKVLIKNKVDYEVNDEAFSGTELVLKNEEGTLRILKHKGDSYLVVIQMVKHSLGGAEAMLKAQFIQDCLSFR